ncbi:unnamed protein product, partial [Allacma fusca]
MSALTVIAIVLVFGVLFSSQKKKYKGITWFPEGFLRHTQPSGQHRRSRRRGPDGQEMKNLGKGMHPL